MTTSFPTGLDTLTNPAGTDRVDTVDHAAQHANANDAIEALEAKVGINASAVTTTHDYKLSGVTGSDLAASKAGIETLTNKTIDGDDNTLQDIGTASLKTKTGVDASVVTGTKGTDGQAGVWNADGDIVGGTVAIATGGTGQTTQTAAMDALSPTTTKGDILVDNGTNVIRVGIGADAQLLTADSAQASGVKWASPAAAITPTVNVYTANDTWTKPASLGYVVVEVVGGGGQGGGASSTGPVGGGGGGGGGYSKKTIAAASLGATEAVTVGTGGSGAAAGAAGNAGNTSSFGTHAQATGGSGGAAAAADSDGGAGGVGSLGSINVKGGGGGGSFSVSGNGISGAGGNSVLGGGGEGLDAGSSRTGIAGGGYGGGGGGAHGGNRSGGAGSDGVVIVYEYF